MMTEAKDACEVTERKLKVAAMLEAIKYQDKQSIINTLANSELSLEDIESIIKDIAKSNELSNTSNNNNNNEHPKPKQVGVY